MRAAFLAILASAALAACTFSASSDTENAETAAPVTLTASGEAQTLDALPASDTLEWAASVVRVDFLDHQEGSADAKLFGLAGGDPAMNGLHTHLAFFRGPAESWQIFPVGDFLEYRVLADSPGRVDLEITESVMNNETGEIGSQTRHLIVTWTAAPGGEAPESITITPATASQTLSPASSAS